MGAGVIALGAYGFVAAFRARRPLRPGPGRAYGGVFIAGSLLWGMAADGFRPDRWDVTGALVALSGVGLIMAMRRAEHSVQMGAVVVQFVAAQAHRCDEAGTSPAATTRRVMGVSTWNRVVTSSSVNASSASRDNASVRSSMACLTSRSASVRSPWASSQPRGAQLLDVAFPLLVVVVAAAHDHLARHPTGRGVQHVALPAADALGDQHRDVAIAALLAQQGDRMPQLGDRLLRPWQGPVGGVEDGRPAALCGRPWRSAQRRGESTRSPRRRIDAVPPQQSPTAARNSVAGLALSQAAGSALATRSVVKL